MIEVLVWSEAGKCAVGAGRAAPAASTNGIGSVASGGPSPLLRRLTISSGSHGFLRIAEAVDAQGPGLRQGLRRTLADHRDGRLGSDFLDLVEEAHIAFKWAPDGEIALGALTDFLGVRYGSHDGSDWPSSHGRATTSKNGPAIVDGRQSGPTAVSSVAPTSTTAMIQASYVSRVNSSTAC